MPTNKIAGHQSVSDRPAAPRLYMTAAIAAGLYAVAGGMVTLVGWALDIPRLAQWRGDGIAMFPNPAACAVLSGLALILLAQSPVGQGRRIVIWMLGTTVAIVGGLTTIEHISGK